MEITTSSCGQPLRRGPVVIGGFVIAVLAVALRWPQMHDSLWLDELHTSWCVSGSWSDVAPRAQIGNQPPCYFFLLRLVVGIGGLNEFSVRAVSLIAGLLLVGLVGFATARWTGSVAAALFAATLVAIDRNCIFYSQEARTYALLQLIAWSHAFVLWELTQKSTTLLRVLFVIGAVLQFYLHYTSVVFLLAELVFLLDRMLDRTSRSDYRPAQLAWDAAAVSAAVMPAAGHLWEIHARRKQWELFVKQFPTVEDFWQLLRLDVYLLPTIIVLVGWYLLRLRAVPGTSSPQISVRRTLSLSLSLLFVPAVLAWLTTRRQLAALFMTRYLVSSLVAAPISAALLGRAIASPGLRASAAGITLVASVWYSGMWQQWQRDGRILGDRRQDWRAAVEFVNRQCDEPSSVCYLRSGFVEAEQLRSPHPRLLEEYCLAPVNNIYKLETRAIPVASIRDIQIDPRWVQAETKPETWFLILGRAETWNQFIADVERQVRPLGLSTAFDERATFGDVLACRLARRK